MSQSSSTGSTGPTPSGSTNKQGEGGQELRSDVDSLKRDLSTIRRDLRETTDRAISEGRRSARHYRDEAYDQAHETANEVRERINTHPIASVCIALGAGMLIGKIFGK